MKTRINLFPIALFAFFVIAISCNQTKPEEIDVSKLNAPCDYVNSIEKVNSEIQKLNSDEKLDDTKAKRITLLRNKISDILTYGDKNNVKVFDLINCPKFETLKNNKFAELCLIEGHIQLAKNNIDNSLLLFDIAKYILKDVFKTPRELYVTIIEYVYNLDKEKYAETLSTILNNMEIAYSISDKSYSEKNFLLQRNLYINAIDDVNSSICSSISKYEFGYFKNINGNYYLLPINESVNEDLFGIKTFNPIEMYSIVGLDNSQINEISASKLQDYIYNDERNLNLSSIPQMKELYNSLRKLDKYAIVKERSTFIEALLNLKKEYSIAELKYLTTNFKFTGRAVANESEYSVDKEQLKILIFIENRYFCTLLVPMPLDEIKSFFSSKRIIGTVDIIASPQKGTNFVSPKPGYYISFTNTILQDELIITFNSPLGKYQFSSIDLKGKKPWTDNKWDVKLRSSNDLYWEENTTPWLDNNKNLWPEAYNTNLSYFVNGKKL